MLHLGIVRPDERGLITNPLGLAALRLTLVDEPKEGLVATLFTPVGNYAGSPEVWGKVTYVRILSMPGGIGNDARARWVVATAAKFSVTSVFKE